jgi:hypoxanthine-DNA glycosylase
LRGQEGHDRVCVHLLPQNQKLKGGAIIAKAPDTAQPPIWRGLRPQVSNKTWLLVLGSFPGKASLLAQQYYGHPQNQFWRLINGVFELGLTERSYAERLGVLEGEGIGLWDVITAAEREGSLDSAIRNAQYSDLHGLLDMLPNLSVIAFNGGTAAKAGRKQLGDRAADYQMVDLPSSSPAYTLAFEKKLQAWLALIALRKPE